jgi:hypothetical protein
LAVVGAEAEDFNPGRRRLWLENVIKDVSSVPEINAITLHVYADSKIASIVNGINCINSSTPFDQQDYFRKGIYNAFEAADKVVVDEIAKIKLANKEVWITEFNMLNNDKTVPINGSWFHGLFVASMAFEFLKDPGVTKLIPHTLIGDAIFSGVFNDENGLKYGATSQYADPESCIVDGNSTTTYQRSALGIALSPLADALKESTTMKVLEIKDVNLSPPPSLGNNNYPDLQGLHFTKPNGNVEIVVMNLSANIRDLNLGSLVPVGALVTYNTWAATSLFNFIADEPVSPSTFPLVDNKVYSFDTFQTIPINNTIGIPAYGILHIRIKVGNGIQIPDAKICCDSWRTYSVNKSTWQEGWSWKIGELPANFSNPYIVNANEFDRTNERKNYDVYLYDNFNNLISQSTLTVDPCPNTPVIGIGPNYSIETQEFCPSSATNFNLTIQSASQLTPPTFSYSYLWAATGKLSNPHGTSTSFVPPANTTEVFAYATDGECWVKSNTIKFQSLSPEVEIVLQNANSNTHVIENDQLRLCNLPLEDIVFNSVYESNFPTQYTINGTWDNQCNSQTSNSNVISSGYQLPQQCNVNLTTDVTSIINPLFSCSSRKSILVKADECCTTQSVSLIPNDANIQHPSASELFFSLNSINGLETVGTPNETNPISFVFSPLNKPFPIEINGLLEIDIDVTLNDCELLMGPNAQIKLIGNNKLYLNNCTFTSCLTGKPWDGIIADDDRQFLSIVGQPFSNANTYTSSLSNAKTGINLSNNVDFLITNTLFDNNQTSISIHDYSTNIPQRINSSPISPISGFVYGNLFSSNAFSMFGLYGDPTLTNAIDLNSLDRIIIGSERDFGFPNYYNNCQTGVSSNDASVSYRGNMFDNI